MFCTHCGSNVPDGTKFCTHCGAVMGSARPAAPVPPPNTRPSSTPYQPEPGYGAPRQTPYVAPYTAAQKVFGSRYMNPVALVGAFLILIGIFLPFITASELGYSISISFFECATQSGNFLLWLVILAVPVLVVLQIVKAPQIISILLAAAMFVFQMILVGHANNYFDRYYTYSAYSAPSSLISYSNPIYSIGFILMIIGQIVIVASVPVYKKLFKK